MKSRIAMILLLGVVAFFAGYYAHACGGDIPPQTEPPKVSPVF
jgi:hypothetical protein